MKTQIELTRDVVDELVGTGVLADYLTAPWGHMLGLYPNWNIVVGEDVGREIAPAERPIVTVKCTGIGNQDMTWWRNDYRGQATADAEIIRDCCEHGDVEDERQELIRRIWDAIDARD